MGNSNDVVRLRAFQKQRGAILVMFTIGLLSLLVVAAMALDGGHMLLSKGRLQNAVDASALQAGKVLQDGGTLFQARQAATEFLLDNLQYAENSELQGVVNLSTPDYGANQVTDNLFIEFSEWPDPFISTSVEGAEYVRVRLENVGMQNFIAQIIDFNKSIRASAVAGKSTDLACIDRLAPIMVCANEMPADPENIPSGFDFGFKPKQLYVLKIAAGAAHTLGPGNFQLLRLDGDQGGSDVRDALAGDFTTSSCISAGDEIPTEPGGTTGPVRQGLNTRFDLSKGGGIKEEDGFLRDENNCQGESIEFDDDGNIVIMRDEEGEPILTSIDDGETTIPARDNEDGSTSPIRYYTHAEYLAGANCPSTGINGDILTGSDLSEENRRMLPIVIGECDGETNGANTITVLGTGCFFLTQDVPKQGSDAYVVGEFLTICGSSGIPSLDPDFQSNNSTIVLYPDLDSPDS
ncbi:TadE/TadG family type IV pilus assembly protein [Shewanella atlantica]|uniref:Pilus assembly protein n=1 Tax=Shewanella atlantica TaxID=271099 RepID=A0A431WDD6_9GAMM|nr:TadE/TadG family type IV pilus assembly protein [Shewanella atlantica]RTR33365.1 pilus assembly protein [Shewanella atlantica]